MLTDAYVAFPEFDIVTAVVSILQGNPSRLHPAEMNAIENAAPGRAREFAAGRQAARQALDKLGLGDTTIGRWPDRRPMWPVGIVGSISHSQTFAVAAVSRDEQLLGLGLDIEQPLLVDVDMVAQAVLSADELDAARSLRGPQLGHHVAKVLGCKEAVYKAVYPIVGEYFDFRDLQVEFDGANESYTAMAISPLRSKDLISVGRGRCRFLVGQIVSTYVIEAREALSRLGDDMKQGVAEPPVADVA